MTCPLDDVVMRGNDDYRPSPALKTDRAIGYFGSLEAMQNQVALVIDDRDDVISAFRDLTTLQIPGAVRFKKRSRVTTLSNITIRRNRRTDDR
jgi:hypothetical protein